MDEGSQRVAAKQSTVSVVDKGWNLVSLNTELSIFIAVGIVGVLAEATGYRPFIHVNDLLPPLSDLQVNNGDNKTHINETEKPDLQNFPLIYKISQGVDTVGVYSVHLYLATYILLPYPVVTEHQRVLLVPWLVLCLLRSVLRELVITLVGVALCSSQDVFYYPCVRYSAIQGAQLCFIFYFWTSVNSFYCFLNQKNSVEDRTTSVINTIKRTSSFIESSSAHRVMRQSVLSVDLDEEDDENTEAALVERAAMAWIAREILENDEDYVTDKQFSQYLVVKATMELRHALQELAEKKRMRRARRKATAKEKIEESLEFMKMSSKLTTPKSASPRLRSPSSSQAFENKAFSKRDPIRNIRPLTSQGKPVPVDKVVSGFSVFSDTTILSVATVDSEAQTEPPTRQMSKWLDMLEQQQQQRLVKKLAESGSQSTSLSSST